MNKLGTVKKFVSLKAYAVPSSSMCVFFCYDDVIVNISVFILYCIDPIMVFNLIADIIENNKDKR